MYIGKWRPLAISLNEIISSRKQKLLFLGSSVTVQITPPSTLRAVCGIHFDPNKTEQPKLNADHVVKLSTRVFITH